MTRTILPAPLGGSIKAMASKSYAHRLLICAALSAAPVSVSLRGLSQDILATCDCLRALGADIREQDGGLLVTPIRDVPKTEVLLPCRESGSTLRFLLPIAAALGGAVFTGTARLRIKESDRAAAMAQELEKFGASVCVSENSVAVSSERLKPPCEQLCGHNDHRIVMALSLLAAATGGIIDGAQAVKKSYPDFFDTLRTLKVVIEEYEA